MSDLFLLSVSVRLLPPPTPPLAPCCELPFFHLTTFFLTSDSRNKKRLEDGRISAAWMENKARISPQTSSRRRCHPLSCYLLFGNWIGGERSYTVIMLPDSINFVFQRAWCKLPVVLVATALQPVQKKKPCIWCDEMCHFILGVNLLPKMKRIFYQKDTLNPWCWTKYRRGKGRGTEGVLNQYILHLETLQGKSASWLLSHTWNNL